MSGGDDTLAHGRLASEGADFPWEDRYAKFKELLDAGALNLKIFAHPDRKALLPPLMKRAELVMADYEEWIVSDRTSIALNSEADSPMGRQNSMARKTPTIDP